MAGIRSSTTAVLLALQLLCGSLTAFVPSAKRTSAVAVVVLQNAKNPFFAQVADDTSTRPKQKQPEPPTAPLLKEKFDPTPDALIAKARVVLATDFGIRDSTVLADDFLWLRPLAEKPMGKVDYLAAGKFFDLRSTFPDLDYRAHDFRIDARDPMTVRCTCRPVGTMRGPLRLRNEVVDANGKILRGPPEAIGMTFDATTGKLIKLCSEFVMDRQVGNTNGLSGVMAASTVAGVPPSDWEIYPVTTVVSRFFGRPMEQIKEPTTFLAPFPETVMISLAKGVLFAKLGEEDPSLLSKDFTFLTPTDGPIAKKKFIESYAPEQFGDFEQDYIFNNYRVDPYDPYRVWVDVKLLGNSLEGPPQAWSFTFDDDGFCTRITGGAVMDPSIGNTGGLVGMDGIRYALGEGSPDIATRPLPLALGRIKKTVISPITKIKADEFVLEASEARTSSSLPKENAEAAKRRILDQAKNRIEKAEKAKRASIDAAKARAVATTPSPLPPPAQTFVPQPPNVDPPQKKEIASPKLEMPEINIELPKINIPRPTLDIPKIGMPQNSAKTLTNSKKTTNKESIDRMEIARKKQQEAKERIAAEAERKRASAQEAREKRLEEQRLNRQRMEEQARAQAEARRKQEEERVARTKKQAEERRRKVEEQRKAQAEARQKQADERQAAAKAAADAKRRKAAEQKTPSPPRPSFQLPRPSLTIPKATTPPSKTPKATPQSVEKQSSFSLPRPSLQIYQPPKPATKPEVTTQKRPSFSLPRPSLQIPKPASPPPPASKKARQREAEKELKAAVPGATISLSSLFGLGDDEGKDKAPQKKSPAKTSVKKSPSEPVKATSNKTPLANQGFGSFFTAPKPSAPSKNKVAPKPSAPTTKKAPRGVPTIERWKAERDKSITGFIRGSNQFQDGEKVTTSPIAKGNVNSGEVVVTSSGTRYFLD